MSSPAMVAMRMASKNLMDSASCSAVMSWNANRASAPAMPMKARMALRDWAKRVMGLDLGCDMITSVKNGTRINTDKHRFGRCCVDDVSIKKAGNRLCRQFPASYSLSRIALY